MGKGGARDRQFDPICGRELAGASAPFAAEYKRRKYFFCSEQCRSAFERHAERLRVRELARAGALLSPGKVTWGVA